jgi:hypothetical protein
MLKRINRKHPATFISYRNKTHKINALPSIIGIAISGLVRNSTFAVPENTSKTTTIKNLFINCIYMRKVNLTTS